MFSYRRILLVAAFVLTCLYLFQSDTSSPASSAKSQGAPARADGATAAKAESASSSSSNADAKPAPKDAAPGRKNYNPKSSWRSARLRRPPSKQQQGQQQKTLTAAPGSSASLSDQLAYQFPYDVDTKFPGYIWQTWRATPASGDFEEELRPKEASWTEKHPGFVHEVVTDHAAELLMRHLYASVPDVLAAYAALPLPILKADFFRYLVLLARGGIYSDIDTTALQPAYNWVPGAAATMAGVPASASPSTGPAAAAKKQQQQEQKGGQQGQKGQQEKQGQPSKGGDAKGQPGAEKNKGQPAAPTKKGEGAGADAAERLPFGLVVGIEADADRPDWQQWYSRRLQFCQWTIQAKPGHPVLRAVVANITQETLRRKRAGTLTAQALAGRVIEFTGPALWTDKIMEYFNDPAYFDIDPPPQGQGQGQPRVTWANFTGMTDIRQLGDVVVLPITSFSPGVQQMGARDIDDPLAYVLHDFQGIWKPESERHIGEQIDG